MWLNLFMVAVGQGMVHIVAVSCYVVQLQCRAVCIDGILFRCGSVLVQLVVASMSQIHCWLVWHECTWFRIVLSCGSNVKHMCLVQRPCIGAVVFQFVVQM